LSIPAFRQVKIQIDLKINPYDLKQTDFRIFLTIINPGRMKIKKKVKKTEKHALPGFIILHFDQEMS